MLRSAWEFVRSHGLRGWLILLIACGILGGVRAAVESGREHDRILWERRSRLISLLWGSWATTPDEVQRGPFGRGGPLAMRKIQGANARVADIAGAVIGPEYAGWAITMTFAKSPDRADEDIMIAGQVTPPPGVTLRRRPTELWWTVEYFRAIVMLAAMVAWGGCLVLIAAVRGIRRQVSQWCLAAALVSIFTAALASDFRWNHDYFTNSHWFETASAMAVIALGVRLFPSRRVDARRCQSCGYDLTGNESGTCPECGTETPARVKQRRLSEMAPAADRLVNVVIFEEDEEPQLTADAEPLPNDVQGQAAPGQRSFRV